MIYMISKVTKASRNHPTALMAKVRHRSDGVCALFHHSSFAGSVLPDGKCCSAARPQLLLTFLEINVQKFLSHCPHQPHITHCRESTEHHIEGDGTCLVTAAAVHGSTVFMGGSRCGEGIWGPDELVYPWDHTPVHSRQHQGGQVRIQL